MTSKERQALRVAVEALKDDERALFVAIELGQAGFPPKASTVVKWREHYAATQQAITEAEAVLREGE
jgi:hypothetical protein